MHSVIFYVETPDEIKNKQVSHQYSHFRPENLENTNFYELADYAEPLNLYSRLPDNWRHICSSDEDNAYSVVIRLAIGDPGLVVTNEGYYARVDIVDQEALFGDAYSRFKELLEAVNKMSKEEFYNGETIQFLNAIKDVILNIGGVLVFDGNAVYRLENWLLNYTANTGYSTFYITGMLDYHA